MTITSGGDVLLKAKTFIVTEVFVLPSLRPRVHKEVQI